MINETGTNTTTIVAPDVSYLFLNLLKVESSTILDSRMELLSWYRPTKFLPLIQVMLSQVVEIQLKQACE